MRVPASACHHAVNLLPPVRGAAAHTRHPQAIRGRGPSSGRRRTSSTFTAVLADVSRKIRPAEQDGAAKQKTVSMRNPRELFCWRMQPAPPTPLLASASKCQQWRGALARRTQPPATLCVAVHIAANRPPRVAFASARTELRPGLASPACAAHPVSSRRMHCIGTGAPFSTANCSPSSQVTARRCSKSALFPISMIVMFELECWRASSSHDVRWLKVSRLPHHRIP